MASVRNAVPGFKASVNGLHFTNAWPHEPDLVIGLGPLGRVPIGDASNGLCGGMVFTVIDTFHHGLPPIPDTVRPDPDEKLFKYIVNRLFDSFDIPTGVARYLHWMTLPDGDATGLLPWFTRRGIAWHTITEEWPRVKADIDAGHLSPLGLVTVHGTDVRQMGHNHQVLAYGYEVGTDNRLTLHLYDPNTQSFAADRVRLSLSLADPTRPSPIDHNVGIGHPIRGFFRADYSPADPTALEPTPPLPLNAVQVAATMPSPVGPGQRVMASVTMQNLGSVAWSGRGPNPVSLGSQAPQDNQRWGTNRVPLPDDVAPGDTVTFTFPVQVPAEPGRYPFRWQMVQDGVTWFGDVTTDLTILVKPPD